MQKIFMTEEQRLLERLKGYLITGPSLARIHPYQSFYIKTVFSKYVMRAVLLQSGASVEASKAEAQEKYGLKCEFFRSLEGLFLHIISLFEKAKVSLL